jgi:hypothetical protein
MTCVREGQWYMANGARHDKNQNTSRQDPTCKANISLYLASVKGGLVSPLSPATPSAADPSLATSDDTGRLLGDRKERAMSLRCSNCSLLAWRGASHRQKDWSLSFSPGILVCGCEGQKTSKLFTDVTHMNVNQIDKICGPVRCALAVLQQESRRWQC